MHTFRNVLTDYLIRTNHLEIIGEGIRKNLSQNPYFQYQTIFQRLDVYRRGYLIPADFGQFMLENKIYPSQTQSYVIFRDFDLNRIGTVTLDKFAEELLPQENQKLKKQASSKKYYASSQRLQIDLEYQLSKYFQHKIRVHNELQQIRVKLIQLYATYSQQAFSLIDKKKRLYLTASDIDIFLRGSGKVLKADEISRIFRVLNQLKSCQSIQGEKLLFSKFIQHIEPLANGYYINYAERMLQKSQLQRVHLEKKILFERQTLKNSRRQIQVKTQLQELRNSRRNIENQILQKELQFKQSRMIDEELLRNKYFR